MGDPVPKAPKLPKGAPQELKDFVSCKALQVDLQLGEIEWLPKPPVDVDLPKPTVSAAAGATPNSATVTVTWGFISIELPVSITDGQLAVDTTNVSAFPGIGSSIDDWVREFNATMRANGKRLAGFTLNGNQLRLTKAAVGVPPPPPGTTPAQPGGALPPPAPTPTPTPTPPVPVPTPGEGSSKPGCGLLGGILLMAIAAIGVGAFFVLRDDDSPSVAPSQPSAPSVAAPTSTQAPVTTMPPQPTTTQPATPPAATTTTMAPPPLDTCDALQEQPINWTTAEIVGGCGWSGPITPCDPALLGCAQLPLPPIFDFTQDVEITHNGSVPDAITGQTGPSQAGFPFLAYYSGPGVLIGQINCANGSTAAGHTEFQPGVPTVIAFPLYSYGACDITSLGAVVGDNDLLFPIETSLLGDGGSFTVGPNELRPPPLVPRVINFDAGAANDALTVQQSLQDHPFGCLNIRLTGGPTTFGCEQPQDPTVTITTGTGLAGFGGWLNPLGQANPPDAALQGYSTAPLFSNGLFPCGPGSIALTVCGGGGSDTIDFGGYATATIITDLAFDAAPNGEWRLYIRDDTEEALTLKHAESWTLDVTHGPPDARVLVRGNSATFVLPAGQFPSDITDLTVREIDPATGESTREIQINLDHIFVTPQLPSDTASTPPSETPEEFVAMLSSSLSTDALFALSRLDGLVLDAYGAEACNTALPARVDPTFTLHVVAVGEVAPWTWTLPDGRTYEVPEALTITVDQTGGGQTQRVDSHIVLRNGIFHWFTYCQ